MPQLKKKIDVNFELLSVALLLIMGFIMGLVKIYSPDLGFHLKSAEWMLTHKQFIYTDTFSNGSEGQKNIDLQWLYQLLIYNIYKGGETMLVTANALLITISIAIVWVRFIKNNLTNNINIKLGFFAFVVLLFVQPLSFEIRPQVFSWIYLNLILFFLELYKRGNKKAVFALPIIMLLWANTHSLSILGLVVVGIYGIGVFFETGKIDKKLLLFSVISLAAFLVNPYFFEGLLFPFKQFGIISGNNLFKSYIGEFQSPFTSKEIKIMGGKYFTSPLLLIHLSAILSVFSILLALKKRQFTDAILIATFLFLLNLGHKNYGYYLMVTLPLIIKYMILWIETRNKKKEAPKTSGTEKRKYATGPQIISVVASPYQKLYKRFCFASIIIAIIISITTVTDGYAIFRTSPYRFGFNESKDDLPVEATAFLIKHHIKGRLLNHLNFGGYLMYHYTEKVFIDGRLELIPEDFFEKYYNSNISANGIKKLLADYNPDVVVFPYLKATTWWSYFISAKNQSGYKPVYFDGLSVIYLKSSTFPQFNELTENDVLTNIDSSAYHRINETIKLSRPSRFSAMVNGIYKKQIFAVTDQNKASYCFTNGFYKAALCYSVMGIENSTVKTPNIFKNLAIFYESKKLYTEASLCEEKSVGSD